MLSQTSGLTDTIVQGAAHASRHRIVVRLASRVVADTRAALVVRYRGSTAYLIPLQDVDMRFLKPSSAVGKILLAGSKDWFDFEFGSTRIACVSWSTSLRGKEIEVANRYVAFDASRVDTIERQP